MNTKQIREQAKGWRFFFVRKLVLEMCGALDSAQQQVEAAQGQLSDVRAEAQVAAAEHEKMKIKHKKAVEGNRAALGFVYARHIAPKRVLVGVLVALAWSLAAGQPAPILRNNATTNALPVANFVLGKLTNNISGNADTATTATSATTAGTAVTAQSVSGPAASIFLIDGSVSFDAGGIVSDGAGKLTASKLVGALGATNLTGTVGLGNLPGILVTNNGIVVLTNSQKVILGTTSVTNLTLDGSTGNMTSSGKLTAVNAAFNTSSSFPLDFGGANHSGFYAAGQTLWWESAGNAAGGLFVDTGNISAPGISTASNVRFIFFNNPNLSVTGSTSSTNGFGSYSTNSTLSVVTTGITNTLTVSLMVLGFTGTSVTYYDNTKLNGISLGTITSPQTFTLQPQGALAGTVCAASGTHSF